jgi:multicomponent Na+:H+ antiporter subunit C
MTATYAAFAVAGWLFLIGVFAMATSRNLIHLIVSLTVVQASTYVLLTGIGFRPGAGAPVFGSGAAPPGSYAVDPVVQALMLTDIVVEATVVALTLAIAIQIRKRGGNADPNDVDELSG